MSGELIVPLVTVAGIAGLAAFLLFLVRHRRARTSHELAAATAIGVALFAGLLAMRILQMGGTAYMPVVLLSVFVGMMSVQDRAWSVEGLCRSMALVTGCAAQWAVVSGEIAAMATSLGVTGLLVYIAASSRARRLGEA